MVTAFEETQIAQARASDPQASVWVSANAGTGKTHVLTQRVIRLLLAGTKPERILCLTFTKAAASEMARRLFQDLGTWSTLPDDDLQTTIFERARERVATEDLPKARRLFAQALETPGGLKIQTIHAFCEHLLGRFPLEAGIAPNFDVLDDRSAAELLDQARNDLFDEALRGDCPALQVAHEQIVLQLTEDGFDKLFREVVDKRSRLTWFFDSAGGVDNAVARLRERMGLRDGETEDSVIASAIVDEWDKDTARRVADVLAQSSKRDQDQGALINTALTSHDPGDAFWIYADAFLKKSDGAPKSPTYVMTKTLATANPDLFAYLMEEQERIAGICDRIKSLRMIESSHALFTLAQRFIALYTREKQRRAVLDYDDLIVSTRHLLERSDAAAWVLYKLDGGLDHILVDEAQDTSPNQWAVIEALTQEFFAGLGAQADRAPDKVRTIFVVGDEKQSIYSFQGADPEKFHDMNVAFHRQVEDAGLPWADVPFSLSFRSTADVLAAVDAMFADEAEQRSLTAAGLPITHSAKRIGQAGVVELWPLCLPPEIDDADPWDAPLDSVSPISAPVALAQKLPRRYNIGSTPAKNLSVKIDRLHLAIL